MLGEFPLPLSRRTVVLLGAAAPLVGCTAFDNEPEATPPSAPHPDEAVRDRAAAAESELIALYAAALLDHPDLAEQLEPFRQRHEEHHAALVAATVPSAATGTATPTGTGAPTPEARRPSVPAEPGEALEELEEAEAAAAEERLEDCLDARGGALAAVLASVAAGEAAHRRLLRGEGSS